MNDEKKTGLYEYESAAERVEDPQRINTVLKGLQIGRCMLTVVVPGVNQPYLSVMLKADPNRGFWIDELTPRSGHEALLRIGRVHINASLHGIGVHFKSVMRQAGETGGVAWYRFEPPEMLHYLQRRSWCRVRVGTLNPVAVHIEPCETPDGEGDEGDLPIVCPLPFPEQPIHGRLFDISRGGIGVLLPRDTVLARGQRLERCIIDIPETEPLETAVEVRHTFLDSVTNMQRTGASFIKLDVRQKRVVKAFVRALERAELRKHRLDPNRAWEPIQ